VPDDGQGPLAAIPVRAGSFKADDLCRGRAHQPDGLGLVSGQGAVRSEANDVVVLHVSLPVNHLLIIIFIFMPDTHEYVNIILQSNTKLREKGRNLG
jgi:hypothetical protein